MFSNLNWFFLVIKVKKACVSTQALESAFSRDNSQLSLLVPLVHACIPYVQNGHQRYQKVAKETPKMINV